MIVTPFRIMRCEWFIEPSSQNKLLDARKQIMEENPDVIQFIQGQIFKWRRAHWRHAQWLTILVEDSQPSSGWEVKTYYIILK